MDSKNVIIAVLCITAIVFFCTLVLVHTSENSIAWADTVDRGGDYVLVTGAFSDANEALYVVDGFNDQLYVYQYDQNRNSIRLFDQKDLRTYFTSR